MEEFKKPLLPTCLLSKSDNEPNDDHNVDVVETATNEEEQEVQEPYPPTNKVPEQNCPYKVPNWSSTPNNDATYAFEVLKSGQIIGEIKNLQRKAYWTFGRLPENDVEMAHPTISRYHAILQYRPKNDCQKAEDDSEKDNKNNIGKGEPPEGWYIYDLDSTHGTFVNKQRLPPKVFIRIRVGHMLRLGASTRSYILQGPTEDEEPESELSITELKAKRQQELEEAATKKTRLEEERAEKDRIEGCGWGMGDDADEETDLTHNPYALTNNEELFLDDPKKTLRGYFEREGLQLEYKCDEMSAGSFVCRVELPLDNENGHPIIAEVVHKGKKKDCVVQCALEACRILDRHGVLRQANQEPLKRKQKLQGSDSDDDEFWDRTGDVARKKQRKATVATSVTLTYDDLLKQETDLSKELGLVVSNITAYQEQQKQLKAQKEREEQSDDLDSFMENLKAKQRPMDKTEIKKLRLEEQRLKSEIQRTQRLIKIAKPVDLPFARNPLNADHLTHCNEKRDTKTRQLPMIGKRNQFSKFKILKQSPTGTMAQSTVKANLDSDEEEVDEDEEENFTKSVTESKCITSLQDVPESPEHPAVDQEMLKILGTNETLPPIQSPKNPQKYLDETIKEFREDIAEKTSTDKHSSLEKLIEPHSSEIGKKRRQRLRHRGRRQEIDMEDEGEYESTEKYAKWMPPENQSGDGFTELNKKFGY